MDFLSLHKQHASSSQQASELENIQSNNNNVDESYDADKEKGDLKQDNTEDHFTNSQLHPCSLDTPPQVPLQEPFVQASIHSTYAQSEVDEANARRLDQYKIIQQEQEQQDGDGTSELHNDNKPDGPRKMSVSEAIKHGCGIWIRIVTKISPILTANVVFMWLFYAPAIVLTPHLLQTMKIIIYDALHKVLMLMCLWASIALAAINIFSFQFTRRAIIFALVPGYIVDNLFYFLDELYGNLIMINLRNVVLLASFSFGLYLVHSSHKPSDQNTNYFRYFALTKDGSTTALLKGVIGFFLFVIFGFFNMLTMYLSSNVQIKVFFRLLIFPVFFSMSKWYQTRVIFNLSKEHMDRRLIVNKMCNHFIQFIRRIFTSNISSKNAISYEFLLLNLACVSIELVYYLFFEQQTRLYYRTMQKCSKFYHSRIYLKKKRLTSITPITSPHGVESDSPGNTLQVMEHKVSEEDRFVLEATVFRAKYIYDDISSEVYSIFLAPLMVYFMHTILPTDTPFQFMSSIQECFLQILVQLFFEFLGDVFSLVFEIRKGTVKPNQFHVWKPMSRQLLFIWSMYCTFATQRILILSS